MWRFAAQIVVAVVAVVLVSQVGYAQEDSEGCEDHPLLSRLEGFYIETCKDEAFAGYEFRADEGSVTIEGHYMSISYRRPDEAPEMAGVEMIRNYTNAVSAIGGEVTYEGRYSASMKVIVEDREIWIEISPYGRRTYRLDIVEKQLMTQQVVADAAALLADIDRVGYAVLHGIYFDTDEAVIKPESESALVEIAKLLSRLPSCSVTMRR
jgi:hypothetical protein